MGNFKRLYVESIIYALLQPKDAIVEQGVVDAAAPIVLKRQVSSITITKIHNTRVIVIGALQWIQSWYFEQCNGDWEHGYGIKINTLDNPGWEVMINIEDTDAMDKSFEEVDINRSENNWLYCKVEYVVERDGLHFIGYGGPNNLEEIINVFKDWVEN